MPTFKPVLRLRYRYKYPKVSYWTNEPLVIEEYNLHMFYVDLFDKMVQKYWRRTKYVSKEHAYVTFFIHTCIHQAFIAFNKYFGLTFSDKNQLQFRIELLQRIREEYTTKMKKHSIHHMVQKVKFDTKSRRRCSYSKCDNKTAYYCNGCNSKFYCRKHLSIIHCNLLNKSLEK